MWRSNYFALIAGYEAALQMGGLPPDGGGVMAAVELPCAYPPWGPATSPPDGALVGGGIDVHLLALLRHPLVRVPVVNASARVKSSQPPVQTQCCRQTVHASMDYNFLDGPGRAPK